MILQTTLTLAAAAIVIHIWITVRVLRVRLGKRIVHGDGGDALMLRRMRAHANFVENVPLVLILIAAIELTGKGGRWLAIAGAAFMLARVAHVIGMDRDGPNPARAGGFVVTIVIEIGLAVVAVLIALQLL